MSQVSEMSVPERLHRRLDDLAEISAEQPGVTRLGYSELERTAHATVADWAAADGASIDTDDAGNTVMTFRPGEPYLLLGSHLDSVPRGGRYDGVIGVLAALEVASGVAAQVSLGVRVVAFACEEGAAFGRPCIGSELATGQFDPSMLDSLRNVQGQTLAAASRMVGLSPGECKPWLTAPAVAAYLELHIEQARVLETEGVALGVVDTIAGTVRMRAICEGRAGHTGATAMRGRADALAATAELILAVETIAQRSQGGVATVAQIEVSPNVVTTIPSEVVSTIDARHYTDPLGQDRMVEQLHRASTEIASRRTVELELRPISSRDPVVLSAWPRQALKRACGDLQLTYRVMPSAGGHDAAVVALRAPAAMLFVQSPGGRSHVPDETCRLEDVVTAVEVLQRAVRTLDQDMAGS